MRLVGGCVRDLLADKTPKDVDLCTDANPDEAIAIYRELGVRHIPTGLDHGTVTVVLNDVTYEITSLREDVATDGRRAVVKFAGDCSQTLDENLLAQFEALGYELDGEYDVDELMRVFQQISQSG
jgi:tRNA nucleotidyltransferase/poly(A) polymerase